MLPPAYTLRSSGVDAEYDAHLAQTGIRTFWENLPEGRDDYIQGMRRMYGFLYQRALETTEAILFLDKTPRYYLILSELKEIFPEARFILLFRNPLAVLSSILRTWVGEEWFKLFDYREDLLKAPGLLREATSEAGLREEVVWYEELVRDPRSEISMLCEHLNIEVEKGMIEYGEGDQKKWTFGDPESVYNHSKPQTSSLEKWAKPDNAQQWRLLRDYAHELGKEAFDALGYSYDRCTRMLESSRPTDSELRYTVSLNWILEGRRRDRRCWEKHWIQILSSMRQEGGKGAVQYLAKRLMSRLE
jgi:hypothetical protein